MPKELERRMLRDHALFVQLREWGAENTTPYGAHTAEEDGFLGIGSIPVERAGAVARELAATLNSEEVEGDVVRWARQAELLSAEERGRQPGSCFAWAEEFLASYGLFLRDSREKGFSRFLDTLAAKDFPAWVGIRLPSWIRGGCAAGGVRGNRQTRGQERTPEPRAAWPSAMPKKCNL